MTNRKRLLAVVVFVVMFVLCFASLAACEQPHEHTLKAYTGVAATCTADGVEAYWQCTDETCNKYFSDSEGTTEITEPKTIAKLGHIDEDKNFKCDRCGVALCEHKTIVKVAAVEATCTTTGTGEYYKCSDCGQMYKDAEGKTKLASVPVIPAKNHSFEDRICTACNARLFEAEDATILSQSNNGDPVVQDTDVASGGKIVGQFAVEGNKLTWIFTLDKAASNVGITMMLSPCEGTPHTLGTDIVINVNDQPVEWKDTVLTPISAPEAWHDYRPFATMSNISLKEGTNKIEFVGVVAINVNIDCMIVSGIDKDAVINDAHVHQMNHVEAVAATCTTDGNIEYWQCTECERKYADEAGSAELTDVTVKASHDFGNGATCSRCHALKLEAEDLEVVGTPTDKDEGFYAKPDADKLPGYNCSGTGWVGNWGNGDNMMYVCITTDKAVSGVKLRIRIACGWTSTTDLLAIYNKTTGTGYLELDRSAMKPFENGNYYNWGFVVTAAFDLAAGDNVIVVEAYEGTSVNMDYVVVENIGDATISVTHVCQHVCPKCSRCTSDCPDSKCAEKCTCPEVCQHEMTHYDEVSATCTTAGTKEYYHCSKCLEDFADEDGTTKLEDKAIPVLGHDFSEGEYCKSCGALKLEAEDLEVTGTPTWNNNSFYARPSAEEVEQKDASGTGWVENWGTGDNLMYVRITTNKAVSDAKLRIRAACWTNGANPLLIYLKKADTKVAITLDLSQLSIVSNGYYNWSYVLTEAFDLVAGDNVIVIEANNNISFNFDYVVVENIGDATISVTHVCQDPCKTCGKCTTDCEDAHCADKCKCNEVTTVKTKLEVEDSARISGSYEIGSNDAASGGKLIGGWDKAYANSKFRIYFTASKAASNVQFEICASTFAYGGYLPGPDDAISGDNAFYFIVNNAEGGIKFVKHYDLKSGQDWHVYDCFYVTMPVDISEGLNYITIVGTSQVGINFDYVNVIAPDDVTITIAHVCQHKCEVCGGCKDNDCTNAVCANNRCTCVAPANKTLKIEAEDCEVTGTPTWNNPSFYARPGDEEVAQKGAGGTGWVENWGNGDNKITIKITSDKAVSGVKLRIRVACGWGACDPLFAVYNAANTSAKFSLDRSEMKGFDNNNYYNWGYIVAEGIDLVAGENEIVVEGYAGQYANIDCFEIVYVGDAKIAHAAA